MADNQKMKALRATDRSHEQKTIDLETTTEQIAKVRLLHNGDRADVWLWRRLNDKFYLAVKSYEEGVHQWHGGVPMEHYILNTVLLPHPRIIRPQTFRRLPDRQVELGFEYYHGGNLSRFVDDEAGIGRSEGFLWNVFVQIADALALLHSGRDKNVDIRGPKWEKVVHADVKPANIFLRKQYETGKLPSLVLGDFGLAFLGQNHNRGCGTPNLQGPEWPFVSAKTDVWGLGAIIHNLAHGWLPKGPMPKRELARLKALPKAERVKAEKGWAMNRDTKQPKPLSRRDYSEALNSCMMRCLDPDVDARIDSGDLVRMLSMHGAFWSKDQKARVQTEEIEKAQWLARTPAEKTRDEERQEQQMIDNLHRDQDEQYAEEQDEAAEDLKRFGEEDQQGKSGPSKGKGKGKQSS